MSKSNRIYLDTSTYLCMLIAGPDSKRILKKISNKILCSSTLMFAEAQRNIVRLAREKEMNSTLAQKAMERLQVDAEHFILKLPDLELCLSSEFPPVYIPKTYDLIHLRTALWFSRNGGIDLFYSLDSHLKKSAQSIGFVVE